MSEATDFVFGSADVVKEYVRDDGTRVDLAAFQTKNNDKLKELEQYKGLRWVSVGKPEIVKLNNQLFGQNKLSFFFHFEMLTNQDREVLAGEVKRAKNISVDPEQFSDIKANSIECSFELLDLKEQKTVYFKGKVLNLNQAPYKVDFKYPINSKERLLFEEEIKTNPINIEFKCSIKAGAQIQKSNTFTITLQESNNIRLKEKIFGPTDESYVTRDQLTELSNDVFSCYSVFEDYQMQQDQFSSAFVENLITLTGQNTFKPVDFVEALNSLSKYSLDMSFDLKPNQVKNDMSRLFRVEKSGNKSHIVYDDKYYNELDKQHKSSGSGDGSVSFLKLFDVKGSGSHVNDQKERWIKNETHLNDQLKDLNNYSKNLIEYSFDGDIIIPKSIYVCKLQSNLFNKNLSFSRIKNVCYEAAFDKVYTLNTLLKAIPTIPPVTKKERTYPNYLIAMLGSEVQLKFFDKNGKGFDEMTDWYLCDGRNGAPDLRGLFITGRHPESVEYNSIGKQGGNNKLKLTIDQMPYHTHLDNGHSHSLDLITSSSGDHTHNYIPGFYFSEGAGYDQVAGEGSRWGSGKRWIGGGGSIENSGIHNHTLTGNSKSGKSILTGTGGNQPFDNRPLYAVVQFIMYIKK